VSGGEILLIATVVAASAAVQAVTGFGFSLLAVPAVSLVVAPETAVVLVSTLGLVSAGLQARIERQDADRATVRWMLAGAALGAPLGLAVLVLASERQLRVALVVVIVAFCVLDLLRVRLERAGRAVDLGAGLVSGALKTSVSTNGPPLVMALHARHLEPPVFRGTLTAVLAWSGVVTVLLFAVGGRYDAEVVRTLAVSAPGLAAGFLVGLRARPLVPAGHFRGVVTGLLALTALVAVVGLLRG
jgi:uncharacterized membrane protein YfcA